MASLTFPELQQKMQLEKKKSKDVKYAFRNAEDIYTTFKELKSDWSVIVTDELVELVGKIFVKATAVAFNDERDERYQSTAYAEMSPVPVFNTQKGQIKQMQDPQWTGAVSSYARKYALQGLFAIGEKDIDEYPVEESQEQGQNNQQQKPNNQQAQEQNQVRYIDNIQYQEIIKNVEEIATIKGAPFDTVANFVLRKYQIDDFHKVPVDGYNIVIDYLTKQIQKAYEKQGV
ncbi:single-stranded DNA-binding protein [Streptococcus pseudopneumoniae]|uniref:ERF family protein n=1 Tax=Streptococcus TaxID=1301 RepID=UPI00110C236B|nr:MULTISPECIES: ERF family protein [Streptococcus]MBF9618431.1 ERF family protein [Streptococcus pseudopneumoniae]MBF9657847.1 ERF family protein [Streptococcus pseudopneumoniae]MBF9659911.1 ERF family protein [Streptococcus pseudopneumoniae]MCE2619510.1 ERF family protein [Streptococcus pseudopneumoniae]TMR49629.1 single-stranded DNA-binding protein [Streptococcus pseudopneumoniae]